MYLGVIFDAMKVQFPIMWPSIEREPEGNFDRIRTMNVTYRNLKSCGRVSY